jgi:hypothetical protein
VSNGTSPELSSVSTARQVLLLNPLPWKEVLSQTRFLVLVSGCLVVVSLMTARAVCSLRVAMATHHNSKLLATLSLDVSLLPVSKKPP